MEYLVETLALMARLSGLLDAADAGDGGVLQLSHELMNLRTYVHNMTVLVAHTWEAGAQCDCNECTAMERGWTEMQEEERVVAAMTDHQKDAWLMSDVDNAADWMAAHQD